MSRNFSDGLSGFLYRLNPIANANYIYNFLGNMKNNFGLISDFTKLTLDDIYPVSLDKKAMLVYAGKYGGDEFFNYADFFVDMNKRFAEFHLEEVKGGHEKMIYDPKPIVEIMKPFLLD